METRNVKKGVSIPDGDSQEAATDDTTAIDETHTQVHEAIMQVRGLASNVARALAAALCAAGVNDDDMLREVTADDVKEVMAHVEAFKEGYPLLLPKNIAIKLRACATGSRSPSKSPTSRQQSALSQHTTTSAAVAIDSIKPVARLAVDTDTSRPGLAKTEDFLHAHIQPYAPYENNLTQIYEEIKGHWDMAPDEAATLSEGVDVLVQQAMARHLTKNMGTGVYNTFVKPQLSKEARECPIMLIWQLLAEARKVSEIDLSTRYTALLQPQKARTIAGLTALYQHQVDEEAELRLHEFVTDKKARPLKEALLELAWYYPVLQTKIEIAWQGAKANPIAALDLAKAEVVSYFSTQPEGPQSDPADRPSTKTVPSCATNHKPPVPSSEPRMLPTGRQMGTRPTDRVCRQFKAAGTCTWGSKCRFSHLKEDMVMLAEVQVDDEEDYVLEMFQHSDMAMKEPQLAMLAIQGIEGFDSP